MPSKNEADGHCHTQWHQEQRVFSELDGSLILEVPYSDERELIADILKHGSEVEVLAPASLRELIRDKVLKLFNLYKKQSQ